jgi:hypothetical protein
VGWSLKKLLDRRRQDMSGDPRVCGFKLLIEEESRFYTGSRATPMRPWLPVYLFPHSTLSEQIEHETYIYNDKSTSWGFAFAVALQNSCIIMKSAN